MQPFEVSANARKIKCEMLFSNPVDRTVRDSSWQWLSLKLQPHYIPLT